VGLSRRLHHHGLQIRGIITCAHDAHPSSTGATHASPFVSLHGPGVLCARRADATPRREAVSVFDLCVPNPEPAITRALEAARAALCQHHAENTDDMHRKNRVRTTRTTSPSLVLRLLDCLSASLTHRRPGLTTVLLEPGWAKRRHLNLPTHRQRLPHLQPLVPRRHDLVVRSLSSLQKRAQAASSDRRCRYCYGTCVFADTRRNRPLCKE
jgi:hypothetical protein